MACSPSCAKDREGIHNRINNNEARILRIKYHIIIITQLTVLLFIDQNVNNLAKTKHFSFMTHRLNVKWHQCEMYMQTNAIKLSTSGTFYLAMQLSFEFY